MDGLRFGGGPEKAGYLFEPRFISFFSEEKVLAVCLALAGKRFL
jgi:hypothetical protein